MCHCGSRLLLPPIPICIIVLPVKIVLVDVDTTMESWNTRVYFKDDLEASIGRIAEYDLNVLLKAKKGPYRCWFAVLLELPALFYPEELGLLKKYQKRNLDHKQCKLYFASEKERKKFWGTFFAFEIGIKPSS